MKANGAIRTRRVGEHAGPERPMPRAARRTSRWIERAAEILIAEPPSRGVAPEPGEPTTGEEPVEALLVDVPDDALIDAKEESPVEALLVDVADEVPDAAAALLQPSASDEWATRPAPPELRAVGAPRPARPRDAHRDPVGVRPGPVFVDPAGGVRNRGPQNERRPRPAAHGGEHGEHGPAGRGLRAVPPVPGTGSEAAAEPGPGPAAATPLFDQDASEAGDVDPRMRARRTAVRRAEGRRRLRVLVTCVGALTLLTLAVAVVYSPLLDVQRVEVTGVDATTAASVRNAAGVSRGDALLRVDTDRVAARLERLPWIARAHVSHSLPHTLRIAVTPRIAVGWVAVPPPAGSHAAATVAVIDGSGDVMQGALVPPSGLPQLLGSTSSGRVGSRLRGAAGTAAARVARILPADLRTVATSLRVTQGLVTVGLDHGPEIRFGTPDALALKGRTALAILNSLPRPVHYIDVRVPSAPVTG